jgi:hypothetical protein
MLERISEIITSRNGIIIKMNLEAVVDAIKMLQNENFDK